MKEIVLWKSYKKLNVAIDEIICLTFLTTRRSVWSIIPLMIRTYREMKKRFPYIKFYSLSFFLDRKRVHFFDMRLSFVPLLKLKKLCMELELNDYGLHIADIDVHIFKRHSGKLLKLSRKIIPIDLTQSQARL